MPDVMLPDCMMPDGAEPCAGFISLDKKYRDLVRLSFILLRTLGYDHDAPVGDKPIDREVNPDFPQTGDAARRVLEALRGG